ncbi:NmrA family NAD(P)-binding protein [Chryseobacterium chendengshani]|uniref:NmrA family NAD(P)-binding protein n=1 Tax=Chryseobacterium sp. LJ668 TaxID=2864040 RepID=UPI001C688F65|nr:NmrA family NAD(P)-binding protein [Chryseobacterium sp. LJ668]MBW8523753.1 NmrA family NAD(P)-binding protein [Chryseobacterium sp. LJ668]QYK16697.1 NmrA family NAD(P)-binding protein [Chryseobacterium sp. LJ668]
MNIITGGTGKVGSAVAQSLLKRGEKVKIISRSSKDELKWKKKGADWATTNIQDTKFIHEVFKSGEKVFVLNPPANPQLDTDIEESKTVALLLESLKDSGIKKIVAESTMGAREGKNIGDLGILYNLEKGIENLGIPYSIIRPAYYMSNWTTDLGNVKKTSELISFFPADLRMPMIAYQDIGELAAYLMIKKNTAKITSIEGPELYSPQNVADTLSEALKQDIKLKVIEEKDWFNTYISIGFSKEAAESYTNMTSISLREFQKNILQKVNLQKGKTTLKEFIEQQIKSLD